MYAILVGQDAAFERDLVYQQQNFRRHEGTTTAVSIELNHTMFHPFSWVVTLLWRNWEVQCYEQDCTK